MATTIYTKSLGITDNGWTGLQLRLVIPTADLSAAPGTGAVSVTFSFSASTSSATIDSAYIGEQGTGNSYNFDGNQVQLLFSGAASISGISGVTTKQTDYVTFSYSSSKILVVSAHFSGTIVNLASQNGVSETSYYQSVSDAQTGATAPTGTFTTEGSTGSGVSLIQMKSVMIPANRLRQYLRR